MRNYIAYLVVGNHIDVDDLDEPEEYQTARYELERVRLMNGLMRMD